MFDSVIDCRSDEPYCESGHCVASVCVQEPSSSLLRNGDFDIDVSSWDHSPGAVMEWSGEDATRCENSGALSIRALAGEAKPSVRQCVSLTPPPGSYLRLQAWIRAQPTNGGAEPELVVHSWDAPDCTGVEVMGGSVGRVTKPDGEWQA